MSKYFPKLGMISEGKPAAVGLFLVGAGSYLLWALLANVWVLSTPDGKGVLQTLILILLGLSFLVAADGFLGLIRAISKTEIFGWPLCSAAAGAVAYTLVYANRVFVNYWYYDDWSYFGLAEQGIDKHFITEPLNDHFMPLFKVLVWFTDRVFGLNYLGAACLQQTSFLLIVLVLSHLLYSATRRAWFVTVVVGSFAMWPSYGAARTWFGGGFWLAASVALLGVYLLHTRSLIVSKTIQAADNVPSFVLAAATVFISSQTLMPAIYAAAFCAPLLLAPGNRKLYFRRLTFICGISLVPTVISLVCRNIYAVHPPMNFSGLFDGHLFANLGIFILNKALFVYSYKWYTEYPSRVTYVLLLFPILVAAIMLTTRKESKSVPSEVLAALLSLGGTIFVLSVAQIGLGRRWSYDAVLNPYYVTLPFFGLWLTWASAILCLFRTEQAEQKAGWARGSSAVAVIAVILTAYRITATGVASPPPDLEVPPYKRVQIIRTQRQFVDDLGAAVCDLARLHRAGPPVRWVPHPGIWDCQVCSEIIAPQAYLQAMKLNPQPFESMSRLAARRRCPTVNLTTVLPIGPALNTAPLTDGNESETAMSFVRTYFGQSLPQR